MNNPTAQALSSVVLGPEVRFENLTMIPLLREAPRGARSTPRTPGIDYLVLDEAIASGFVQITEVSEQGSVPELRVINHAARPVLIIDGEELVGAKQNRVVNLTILVAAHSELKIPVSCVEAGRWHARSLAFSAAPRAQYATGRAKRMKQVTDSIAFTGDRLSDQAAVWADIANKSARMHAASRTSAMEALFVDNARSIDLFVRACFPVEGQYGALFAVSGSVVAADLFDRPATLRRILPKLVRSVAVDALDRGLGPEPGSSASRPRPEQGGDVRIKTRAKRFLAAVSAAPQHVTRGVGVGEDVRITAPGITGAALVADGTVLHVSAFALS